MIKYPRIYKALCSMPWMIQPEKLEAIAEFFQLQLDGGKLNPEEIAERTAHPKKGFSRETHWFEAQGAQAYPYQAAVSGSNSMSNGLVAVLPIYGVIAHRAQMNISSGGGFNIEDFRTRFQNAVDDPNVKAIVLDIDSPGGTVSGVDEMSKQIFQARTQKQITAVANTQAASAAYYLASAATELVVTPSGDVGSIGVYMLHSDMSSALQAKGINTTLIKAGKFKAEGNPYQPLDDEALASLQSNVDDYYDMFVKAVARNRGVSAEDVRGGFGQGRTVLAKEAVKQGMADRVGTLEEVISGLTGGRGKRASSNQAEQTENPIIAAEPNVLQRQMEIDLLDLEAN